MVGNRVVRQARGAPTGSPASPALCSMVVQRPSCDRSAVSAVWPREETVQKAALLSEVAGVCASSGEKCLIGATAICSLHVV